MAENRKQLTGRSQKQQRPGRRHLRFEPLESRSLLSAIGVTAPGPRPNLGPIESLPQQTEAVSPADLGENASGFAQADSSRQYAPSPNLAGLIAGPAAESSDRRSPLDNEFIDLVPLLTGNPRDPIGESMATPAQLPHARSADVCRRAKYFTFIRSYARRRQFARPGQYEESSGLADSIAVQPAIAPESRLFVEVIFVSPALLSLRMVLGRPATRC